MKFLVKSVPMGIPPMPPEQVLQLLLATFDYFESLVKKGKIVGGPFAGEQGGGGVIEVESLEELHAILSGGPNAGIASYEVHALTTFEAVKKGARQQLEALKKRGK